MLELILAFLAGTIVMDFMWAWRLGIPQILWVRFKLRRLLKEQMRQEQQ
jgi:hypothetical protein